MSTKPTNPKDLIGTNKLPLHLFPATAIAVGCLAFLNGMLKYGWRNWLTCGVRCSIYLAALKRHIARFEEGEECDEEGVPHLASMLACIGIIIDARTAGKLTDDRPISNPGYSRLVDDLTPIVEQLRKRHEDKNPIQHTKETYTFDLPPC